jgi:transcription antitermination factor NusB
VSIVPEPTKPTRKRTRAREIAIQALYQYDALRRIASEEAAKGKFSEEALEEVDRFIGAGTDDPQVREFARELVLGTSELLEEIDAQLAAVVENWKLERVAAMDRAILRLATYELLARSDVPPKVSINEAIDLAKKYSTAQSGAFVNGILDKLLQLKHPEKAE